MTIITTGVGGTTGCTGDGAAMVGAGNGAGIMIGGAIGAGVGTFVGTFVGTDVTVRFNAVPPPA